MGGEIVIERPCLPFRRPGRWWDTPTWRNPDQLGFVSAEPTSLVGVASTFAGIAVLVVALLPGAVYTWSFERIAGRWGIGLSDRLYRFFGLSAFFQVLIAPLTWKIWLKYLRHGAQSANRLPWWLWPAALAYLGVPALLGFWLATAFKNGGRQAKWLVGPTAAPTAWDAVFSGDPAANVILRLKSGGWIGGEYSDGSCVAGYPEPADIYLSQELSVNQETGDFARDDTTGEPVRVPGYGILVRWEEVEYLEISN